MVEKILIGVIIGLAALVLLLIIIQVILAVKKNKKEPKALKNAKGANEPAQAEEEKKPAMTCVIARGESKIAGSEGDLPCGEYIIESGEGAKTFKARIGRYVKEYESGTVVVLKEAQMVAAVDSAIVLRKEG